MLKRLSTVARAKALRKSSTPEEKRVWGWVSAKKFLGLKFRRQHRLGPYICDFVCEEKQLVLELDGSQHTPEKDAVRDEFLQNMGYQVLHIPNATIKNSANFDSILMDAIGYDYQTLSGGFAATSPLERERKGIAK
jgi:very-short-patch-repair endonuclease